ncbi:MAG: hypothetical protein R3358_07320 [Woeseiaceae bacterium]|nr:hypothetical protein [Woeseiaceae bacterium]
MTDLQRFVQRTLLGIAAVFAFTALVATLLWRDRASIEDIHLPPAPHAFTVPSEVTVTWFGVSTLLFDDGETQILIDGFVSRPTLYEWLTQRPVDSDFARVNWFMNEYRVRRLAAIIPVHSHFDHAMDAGAIANRSSASILGSESTANIARGAGVPEDQIVVVADGAEYAFGNFGVRFIESNHAPIGWAGATPWSGSNDEPLVPPAPVSAWREGGSYSVIISHPAGTTLVQGSGGMKADALTDVEADTVILGVALIEGLGRDYVEAYWRETVTSTGADVVIPVHFDDYTQPFGTIELWPLFLDDFRNTAEWLVEIRNTWDADAKIYLPEHGQPIALYAEPEAEPEA